MRIAILICLSMTNLAALEKRAVGLTGSGHIIEALEVRAASDQARTVIIVGGLDGPAGVSRSILAETAKLDKTPAARRRFHLFSIAVANPDRARLVFPPTGPAYKENTESHYLWRWIGTRAPDLVIVVGRDDAGLAEALSRYPVAGMGKIPARRVEKAAGLLRPLREIESSEAARELRSRLARSARQLAEELEPHYGHAFEEAVYIPAVALIGRLRLGHTEDVQRIVAPFATGSRNSLAKPTGSHLSGHLIFAELAERTGDRRYIELVRKAADLGFTESREMKESMPLHSEMSDAVFMSCPILAKAGKLTGEQKYFDMALRHFRFMQKLCLRPDGLYRHSPLDEAAWGRGNAFPALGLAFTLSDMPEDHPGFAEMSRALRDHAAALSRFQDENGMWRQVIDQPGSYAEFSATAMIGTALARAVRRGWLDGGVYQSRLDAAWRGVLARARDGRVVDVCESTGKQKSLQEYLNRIAILDRDARGGAMALLFAAEIGRLD
jgi:unsaturated rhamnogalacturonyl hydrolase